MANLTRRFTWKKWAPDIGENRELEGGPVLFLELATGLTGAQMRELGESLGKAREVMYVPPVAREATETEPAWKPTAADYAAAFKVFLGEFRAVFVGALNPYVRLHQGPHTIDGQVVATLDDYLKLTEEGSDMGVHARTELEFALNRFNSVEGPDELFSLRSSGGAPSTAPQRTRAPGATAKTAAP